MPKSVADAIALKSIVPNSRADDVSKAHHFKVRDRGPAYDVECSAEIASHILEAVMSRRLEQDWGFECARVAWSLERHYFAPSSDAEVKEIRADE